MRPKHMAKSITKSQRELLKFIREEKGEKKIIIIIKGKGKR